MPQGPISSGSLPRAISPTQADQGDGRPRLPLGQPVLGLFRSLFVHAHQAPGDLRLEHRQHPGRLLLGERKEAGIRLRAGVHEQVGQQRGIVAGVVNQDGGGKGPFTLESAGVPEDARQGSQQSLPDGSQGLDQRRVIAGILDRGCEELVGDERRDAVPAVLRLGGIGVGQGTGRAEAWLLVGFGIVEQGP